MKHSLKRIVNALFDYVAVPYCVPVPLAAFSLDHSALGSDLKSVRESLKLSIAEVAKQAGIAPSHVWNLEKGIKEMSLEKFFRLCAALCLPSSEILADNIRVERDYFAIRARALAEKQFEANIALFVADYVAGCATIITYLLLTPQLLRVSFTFPIIELKDAFFVIQQRIRLHMSIRDRHALLLAVQDNPMAVVNRLQLLSPQLFAAFVKAKEPIAPGTKEVAPWYPEHSRSFQFPEETYDVFAAVDPAAFGAVIREMSEDADPMAWTRSKRKPRKRKRRSP